MATPIHAITFDLWATLLSNPAEGGADRHMARVQALHDALCARGDAVEADAIDRLMRAEWRRYNRIWADEQRTMLNHERLTWMLGELGVAALEAEVAGSVCAAFDESIWQGAPRLCEGAREVLEALSRRDVGLGVVSDTSYTTGRTMRRLLEREGVLALFAQDALVFSDEVGASKPRVSLFEQSLAALGVEHPRHAAHIGDNPETDVRGANAAGMLSVLFHPEEPAPDPLSLPDEARPDRIVHRFDQLLAALGLD